MVLVENFKHCEISETRFSGNSTYNETLHNETTLQQILLRDNFNFKGVSELL